MRTRLAYVCIGMLTALALVFSGSALRAQGTSAAQQWEYLQVVSDSASGVALPMVNQATPLTDDLMTALMPYATPSPDRAFVIVDVLKVVGDQGWELIQVVPVASNPVNEVLYFKRPKT